MNPEPLDHALRQDASSGGLMTARTWGGHSLKLFSRVDAVIWAMVGIYLGLFLLAPARVAESLSFVGSALITISPFLLLSVAVAAAARAVARARRHGGFRLLAGAGCEDVEDGAGAVRQPDRVRGFVLALRRLGVDLPVPEPLPAVRRT